MADSSGTSRKLDDSAVVELTGKIMVVAIIVLFVVVVFVFFLHLYAKWFWYRREQDAGNTVRRRRRRLDFAPGHQELDAVTALRHGLDPYVLKSIPIVQFSSKDSEDGLECAVCLSEVSEGEKIRLLPKCNHGFHVECIDMWFQSHSTCPLCRNPVSNQSCSSPIPELSPETILQSPIEEFSSASGYSTDSPNFPTNVLFWGNETQVSTLGSYLEEGDPCTASQPSSSTCNRTNGMLVIDIPRQINEEEDQKSPIPTRLRSLKRLLSRDRRVNPCSPSNVDVEQQLGRGQS